MVRLGLPKKYAKMGFNKGWKEYKKTKKRMSTGVKMARKKTKTKYKRVSGFTVKNAMKALVGAGLAAVYEVYVSPMIPLQNMVKNIIELIVGLMVAAYKKLPMPIRAFGGALATINAYSLLVPLVQGIMPSSEGVDSGF